MAAEFPLEQMTTEEKLRLLEALWADFCTSAKAIRPPQWHHQILDGQEKWIHGGKGALAGKPRNGQSRAR